LETTIGSGCTRGVHFALIDDRKDVTLDEMVERLIVSALALFVLVVTIDRSGITRSLGGIVALGLLAIATFGGLVRLRRHGLPS
jgi:hypothetical protein